MPKMVTYELDGYDGGLQEQPEPSAEGLLQLTDTHWGLTFPDQGIVVSGGLLRSEFAFEAVERRRCVVRLTADRGDSCSLILLAPAAKVEKVVALRMARLTRICEDVDGVASGQWWRDSSVFADLGQLQATSIGGVRYEGGWWKDDRVRPNRWRAVLDVAPEGLVMRKWRRKLCLPWALIDSLEVVEGPPSVPTPSRGEHGRKPDSGTSLGATIVVRSPSGRTARFSTAILTPDAVRLRLAPIIRRLEETSSAKPETISSS